MKTRSKKHHWSHYPFLRRNKWPDFWFTVAVRTFFGFLFGELAGLLVGFSVFWALYGQQSEYVAGKMILRWNTEYATERLVLWFGAWGLIGILTALCKTPDWQRPWYKQKASTNMAWKKDLERLAAKKMEMPRLDSANKKGEAKRPRPRNLFETLSYFSEPLWPRY